MAAGRWALSVVRPLAVWLLLGLVLGAAWRWLTPVVQGRAEGFERDLSGDVTLAALEVAVGVVAALRGLLRPGTGAATRFGVAAAGATVASLVAWGTGRLLGSPGLSVTVVLLLCPLAVALVTVLGSLVATVVAREPHAE